MASRVAIVIPETGFELVPIRPTIRDDTVTKKKPNTTMRTPSRMRPPKVPGRNGNSAMMATSARLPPTTTPMGRSWLVREGRAAPAPARMLAMLPLNAATMVGSVRRSVMNPPAATAPAPIWRTYAR